MNGRQIFPQLGLLKKEVTERFLTVTREIYRNHPVYNYEDKESESNIFIYPSYSDTDFDGKQPRIISKAGSYDYHLMDTLYGNMSKEVKNNGAIAGYAHAQIVPITITLLIQAYTEEESSNIADELASVIVFACRKLYSREGLVNRGVRVSETDLFDREQNIYQTTATVSFDVPWSTSEVDTGQPIDGIDLSPEEPEEDPLYFDTYRPPGVGVSIQKNKR